MQMILRYLQSDFLEEFMANIYSTSGGALNYLRMISENLENNHFTISNSKNVMFALNYLNRFFGTTTEETVILTGLLSTKFNSDYDFVTIADIAKNFNTTPFRILEFSEEIESLIDKNLIRFHQTEPTNIKVYVINDNVLQAINKNDSSRITTKSEIQNPTSMRFIEPNKIKETKLFYSSEIENEITRLEESLSEKNFMEIQNRLEEKGMAKGITIMLHGYSGTGKTETVYQIARKTNRPILYADFGSIISKWSGETEQNISALFKEYTAIYTAFTEEDKNVPILLINEADTLFGKRSTSPETGFLIAHNTLQNLLLDLMDGFDGIMIITTNIAENFDQAFERRFLFKIKFEKPNEEMRKLMWKSKISGISEESAGKFAKKYDFSGGQIQNIVKKITLNEILSGHKNNDDEIDDLCKTEKLNKQENHHIGFGG